MTDTHHDDGLGGSITILEAGDHVAPMRFRMVMPEHFGPPAPEMHPSQREELHVLRGSLDLGMVEGKHVVLKAGDRFTLQAGVYHHPKNPDNAPCEFEGVLIPGLASASMFADLYAQSREHRGVAQFVRVAMVFRYYRQLIAFKAPIRAVMAMVAAIGRLARIPLSKSQGNAGKWGRRDSGVA